MVNDIVCFPVALTKVFLWAEAGTGLGCLMPIIVEQSHQTDFRQTRNLQRLLFKKARPHMDHVWKQFLQLQCMTMHRGVFVRARCIFLRDRTRPPVAKSEASNIFTAHNKSSLIKPRKYFVWSNSSAEPVDATHYIRLHRAAEKCSLEGPSAKGWLLWI